MTTNTHFETKEHYLAFRKAWSNAVNSEKAKKKVVEEKSWDSRTMIRVTQKGWLTSTHMMVYNMLRGRAYDRGFTMITNRNKLMNGTSPNLGLIQTIADLNRMHRYPDCMSTFLEPFDGTVTEEMILALEVPECKQLYKDFGPGMKVIPMLISGESKARTQTDLDTLLKEVA